MPVPSETNVAARPLLRDDIYIRLRNAIVDGTLKPGEQLRDAELATWLGVSRTPIREALQRLGQAGLVQFRPSKSTVVADLDSKAVREAQSVVAAMHALALQEAIASLTAADLDQMRTANAEFAQALSLGDVDRAIAADDELHGIAIRVCGNTAIATVLEQFTPVLRRVESVRFASLSGRASVHLHDRLIAACEVGDSAEAISVSNEIWHTLDVLLDDLN